MQRSLRSVWPGLAWLGQPLSQPATPPPHATHATHATPSHISLQLLTKRPSYPSTTTAHSSLPSLNPAIRLISLIHFGLFMLAKDMMNERNYGRSRRSRVSIKSKEGEKKGEGHSAAAAAKCSAVRLKCRRRRDSSKIIITTHQIT